MLVLLLLLSSLFAFAQETTDASGSETACNLGCKIWQFFFGSKEARAGKAWFDRGALVGQAAGWDPLKTQGQYLCKRDGGCRAPDNSVWIKGQVATISDEEIKTVVDIPLAYKGIPPPWGVILTTLDNTHYFAEGYELKDGNWISIDAPTTEAAIPTETTTSVQPTAPSTQEAPKQVTLTDIPTWTIEADSQFHAPGTVYKNAKGEYFITDSKGVGVKVDSQAALTQLQQNAATSQNKPATIQSTTPTTPTVPPATAPAVPAQPVLLPEELTTRATEAQNLLGDTLFTQYGALFIKYPDVSTQPTPQGELTTYPLNNNFGTITAVKDAQGFVTVTGKTNIPNAQGQATEWSVLRKDGQTLATQTLDQLKQGVMAVGPTGEIVTVGKGVAPTALRSEKPVYNVENGEKVGSVQYAGDKLEIVDFKKETQTILNTKTQEKETLTIDYYQKGEAGCTTDGGCKVATGGTATQLDANGKLQEYLVDYDYKTSTGADRTKSENLEDVELFNPQTGRQEGTRLPDGTQIVAERRFDENGRQAGYTGEFAVTYSSGLIVKIKKEGDKWVAANPDAGGAEKIAIAELLENPEIIQILDDRESSTTGSLAAVQGAIQSVYSITNNLKSYPAISNLLFGETDFYKKWRSDMDKAFVPLLASNWFPSAICENDELHWQDIEPEGKAVIKTTSGTYQAVASIQMERSPETSPILCHKNPDEDSEELFICESRQVCVDDNFCYADNDRDNEPDNNEPLKGYFYKVTWAVSSPQDEAFTPLRDENGVAVSFNVFLYPGAVPMYNLNGNIASPIQLQNGAKDKDAIIKYSTNVYDQACIRWNQAPISIGVAGREGETAAGFGAIEDVCFNVVTSTVGQVNWDRSGKSAASVTVSHGEVSKNTDW